VPERDARIGADLLADYGRGDRQVSDGGAKMTGYRPLLRLT